MEMIPHFQIQALCGIDESSIRKRKFCRSVLENIIYARTFFIQLNDDMLKSITLFNILIHFSIFSFMKYALIFYHF